jgi:hypothetical protein
MAGDGHNVELIVQENGCKTCPTYRPTQMEYGQKEESKLLVCEPVYYFKSRITGSGSILDPDLDAIYLLQNFCKINP